MDHSDRYARYQRLKFDRPHPRVLRIIMENGKLNATDHAMHSRAGADLARHRRRSRGQRRDHHRRRQGVLRGRRLRHDQGHHERFRDPRARLEGGARHRLQHHQLLEAGGQRHARRGGGRGPGLRPARRHLDRRQELPHHRRPHAPRRRGGRPCGDRLAAPVRHGAGQILPDAVRPAARARKPSASASSRFAVDDAEVEAKALEVATRLAEGAQSAIRWTKYSLNNWLRQAGPTFDASLALEFLGFTGPEAAEGLASHLEKRKPAFPPRSPL